MKSEIVKRYPALNTVAIFVGSFARILISISFVGIMGGVIFFFTDSWFTGLIWLGSGLVGIVSGFFILVFAESVKVVVDIETNTRQSADALALMAKGDSSGNK